MLGLRHFVVSSMQLALLDLLPATWVQLEVIEE